MERKSLVPSPESCDGETSCLNSGRHLSASVYTGVEIIRCYGGSVPFGSRLFRAGEVRSLTVSSTVLIENGCARSLTGRAFFN